MGVGLLRQLLLKEAVEEAALVARCWLQLGLHVSAARAHWTSAPLFATNDVIWVRIHLSRLC